MNYSVHTDMARKVHPRKHGKVVPWSSVPVYTGGTGWAARVAGYMGEWVGVQGTRVGRVYIGRPGSCLSVLARSGSRLS